MDSVKVILDENINVGSDRAKLLRVNGTQITYNNPQNNGSIVGGQILFSNITLPSLANSVISRNMRIRYRVTVTATTTTGVMANASAPYTVPKVTFRPFPLSTCTDTAILTVNNVPVAVSLRQVMPAILRTIPKKYLEKEASECPTQLDNSAVLINDAAGVGGSYAISSQPSSSMINCPNQTSRGSFLPISSVSAGGTTVYTFELCEPIFVPPLSLYDDKTFLANVNTLSYQANYSLLNDMCVVAVDNGLFAGTGTAPVYPAVFSVALVDNSARLEYSVISLDSRVVAIPRVVSYDYALPQFFPTPISAFANPLSAIAIQSTGLIQSQSLRLSYMPGLIYVYAQVPVNTRAAAAAATAAAYSDTFLALGTASGTAGTPLVNTMIYNTDQTNVVSIQLNNRQGLLSGASIKDLYRIACSNGYSYPYSQWLVNPIVIINPTKDLGLDLSSSDIYPNQNGNVTLSIQVGFNTWNYSTATNQFATAAPGWATLQTTNLMVVCVQEGICELSPDTLVINTGALSATEVKMAIEDASKAESAETAFVPSSVEKAGGGALSDLYGNTRSVISGVAKGVGSVIDDPLFRMALKRAETLGGGAMTAGAVTGGRVRRR